MSGVITTSSFAKSLFPGVNKWYGDKYSEYPVEWDKLFDKSTSKRAWEEDVGISGLGLLSQKAEGAGIVYDTSKQGFTTRYNHVVYASGFVVTREAYEDDLYDVVGKQKAQALAFSVRQTKEILAANVYNRAFNTSYVGGDAARCDKRTSLACGEDHQRNGADASPVARSDPDGDWHHRQYRLRRFPRP